MGLYLSQSQSQGEIHPPKKNPSGCLPWYQVCRKSFKRVSNQLEFKFFVWSDRRWTPVDINYVNGWHGSKQIRKIQISNS